MPKEVSVERLIRDARRVLENPFWIPFLDVEMPYSRLHDDHDGSRQGRIVVSFNQHGDAYINAEGKHGLLRFRTGIGGGLSERTRNALMILAWAIKLDNEERPLE